MWYFWWCGWYCMGPRTACDVGHWFPCTSEAAVRQKGSNSIHKCNMWRSRSFGDKRNTTAREKYVFWRNKVVKLTKSSVNGYFSNQCSGPINRKQFFKIVKPFMNNKANQNGGNTIMLRENNRIISDVSEVAEILNVFYSSISNYPVNLYDDNK